MSQFTEYSFSFLHRPIDVRVHIPLEKNILEGIGSFIQHYKTEVSLANSQGSAQRFLNAPLNFPVYIEPVFLDYLYEMHKLIHTFDLSLMDLPKEYSEVLQYDPIDRAVIKIHNVQMPSQVFFTSIALEFIKQELQNHNDEFSIESGMYYVGQNAQNLQPHKEEAHGAIMPMHFEFTTKATFPMTQDIVESYPTLLIGDSIHEVEAFTHVEFESKEKLIEKGKAYGIEVVEV